IIQGLGRAREPSAPRCRFRSGLRRGRLVESRGNLLQTLAQGFAEPGEDFAGGFLQALFGGRRDFRDDVAGLMIECSHGCHHPGVGDVFQAPAVLRRRLFADLRHFAAHFRLFGFAHRSPCIQHAVEAGLHLFLRLRQAPFHRAMHRGLKAPQKIFLSGGQLVAIFHARRVQAFARLLDALLHQFAESIQLLPGIALDFVGESRRGRIGRLGKQMRARSNASRTDSSNCSWVWLTKPRRAWLNSLLNTLETSPAFSRSCAVDCSASFSVRFCNWVCVFFSYHSADLNISSKVWCFRSTAFASSSSKLRPVMACADSLKICSTLPRFSRKRASESANASSAVARTRSCCMVMAASRSERPPASR